MSRQVRAVAPWTSIHKYAQQRHRMIGLAAFVVVLRGRRSIVRLSLSRQRVANTHSVCLALFAGGDHDFAFAPLSGQNRMCTSLSGVHWCTQDPRRGPRRASGKRIGRFSPFNMPNSCLCTVQSLERGDRGFQVGARRKTGPPTSPFDHGNVPALDAHTRYNMRCKRDS
jgi:hypothetical protein